MKVLFIATLDPSGQSGHNIATKEVLFALLRNPELETSIITAFPSREFRERIAGKVKSVEYLPPKKIKSVWWNLRMQIAMIPAFLRIMRRERPDCIITRLGNCITLPILAWFSGVPFYVLIRGLGSRDIQRLSGIPGLSLFWKLNAFLHCRIAREVYVAYREILEVVGKYRRPGQAPPQIFPNAVDPSLFPKLSLAKARALSVSGIGLNDFVIGFAGSIKQRHCLHLLLDCYRSLKEEISNLVLLIAGDGPELDNLKQRAVEEGFGGKILFTGFIPHEKIHTYMAASDILYGVIDPREVENPIKCYEYLASGRPIITSEKEEFRFVEDHNFGVCLKTLDPESLSSTVRLLHTLGRQQLTEMGCAGREYVLAHHTWDRLANVIISDFRAVQCSSEA